MSDGYSTNMRGRFRDDLLAHFEFVTTIMLLCGNEDSLATAWLLIYFFYFRSGTSK